MLTQVVSCEQELATVASSRFIIIGILTGFTSSLFAAGGAPVVVFGLLWLCGYSIKEATGHSLATLAVGAIVGFTLRLYLQSADLQLSMAMTMLPFGIAGVVVGHMVAKRESCKFLQQSFSCFVIFIGLKMMGISVLPTLSVPQGDMHWLLYATAALAGFGSRMLGTGGGLLTVPILIYSGLAAHQALITSLCLNIPMMLLGAKLNLSGRSPQWKQLRCLMFGAMTGAFIGAYISYVYVPDMLLRTLFGGLLVASALITIAPHVLRTLRIHISWMRQQRPNPV